MVGLIDMEWKGYESIIHDHYPWLWPMGNHDGLGGCTVYYSDWGDFRRRRAVDISSFSGANELTHYPLECVALMLNV